MPRREKDWGSSSRILATDASPIHKQIVTHAHEPGKVYARMFQPGRDVILNRNAELQKNPGVIKDLSFGRHLACIPTLDYERLKRENPALRSPDAKVRSAKMIELMKRRENKQFLVQ